MTWSVISPLITDHKKKSPLIWAFFGSNIKIKSTT